MKVVKVMCILGQNQRSRVMMAVLNSDQDATGANSDCLTKSVSDVVLFALSFVPNCSVPHRRAV